jgi:hypothetical protein
VAIRRMGRRIQLGDKLMNRAYEAYDKLIHG